VLSASFPIPLSLPTYLTIYSSLIVCVTNSTLSESGTAKISKATTTTAAFTSGAHLILYSFESTQLVLYITSPN
ncbi:hypothetical protein, partial [Staphylococcus aureus]